MQFKSHVIWPFGIAFQNLVPSRCLWLPFLLSPSQHSHGLRQLGIIGKEGQHIWKAPHWREKLASKGRLIHLCRMILQLLSLGMRNLFHPQFLSVMIYTSNQIMEAAGVCFKALKSRGVKLSIDHWHMDLVAQRLEPSIYDFQIRFYLCVFMCVYQCVCVVGFQ